MDFNWSTPARALDSRVLDPIPVELYDKIFHYLDWACYPRNVGIQTLVNTALVCKLFRMKASMIIFKTIWINFDELEEAGSPGPQSALGLSLCRRLYSQENRTSFLEQLPGEAYLYYFSQDFRLSDPAHSRLLEMIMGSLQHMSNLRTLSLTSLDLNESDLRAICSLNITYLTLKSVSIQGSIRLESIADLKLVGLEDLEIAGEMGSAEARIWEGILDVSHLRVLHLEADDTFMECLIPKLIGLDDHTNLKEFTLGWGDSKEGRHLTVYLLAELCRHFHLLTLEVPSLFGEIPPGPLPLTDLERLKCSRDVIPYLPRLDRLVFLDLNGYSYTPIKFADLSCFSTSFAQLKFLGLPFHVYHENPIARFCPALVELHLDFFGSVFNHRGEWTLPSLVRQFEPSHSVRTFYMPMGPQTILRDELIRLLDSAPYAFPNIRALHFEEAREWLRFPDGTWKDVPSR